MTENDPLQTALAAIASALQPELDELTNHFPEDVLVAAGTAEKLRMALSRGEMTAEPWPPMRIRLTS